jgi:hypothetical protein
MYFGCISIWMPATSNRWKSMYASMTTDAWPLIGWHVTADKQNHSPFKPSLGERTVHGDISMMIRPFFSS